MTAKTLEDQALSLPPEERVRLIQRLLLSLDNLSPGEIEDLWLAEAERRARELESGQVESVPAEEVWRKVRALLR